MSSLFFHPLPVRPLRVGSSVSVHSMYLVTEFNSWEDLKVAFSRRPLWGFRGQGDFRWPLETNILRQAIRNGTDDLCLLSRESWVLYQFQRFGHHYKDDFPDLESTLDWLALIQHYGGPTRLLDFTYSLYIAAFFAIEATDCDAAIWAVNTPALELAMHERLGFQAKGAIHEIRKAHNDKFNELINNPSPECAVLPVEPDKMHERMWIQQGFFLCPTHPNIPFMGSLAATFDISLTQVKRAKHQVWSEDLDARTWAEPGEPNCISLVKIRIPREQHEDIKADLELMNIHAATLFPGLEGFARSLRQHV